MAAIIKKYNPGGVDEATLCQTGTGGFLSGGYLRDDPLESYLGSQETAVFALSNSKFGVEYEHEKRDETTRVRPGEQYRAFAVVTDSRLLFIVGDNEGGARKGDHSVSIPLADIAVVERDEGMLTGTLVVVTSAEMRWRFACRADLGPVVDYLEAASTTWMRVEGRLEDARKHLVDATQSLEATAYDDAMSAVRAATSDIEAARRRERSFCEDGVPAIDSQIERLEGRVEDVYLRLLRARATHRIDAAERHWREDDFDAAYRAYSDAHGDYEAALDVADPESEAADRLEEKLDRVQHNMSYLERAPIRRAETAAAHADDADAPAERARHLERALDCYRSALELDWGRDPKRFECDTESVRERVDDVAAALVDARRSQATEYLGAAEEHYAAGRYRRARADYRDAREALRAGRDTARELVPDAADAVTERLAAVEDRLSEIEARLDAAAPDGAAERPETH